MAMKLPSAARKPTASTRIVQRVAAHPVALEIPLERVEPRLFVDRRVGTCSRFSERHGPIGAGEGHRNTGTFVPTAEEADVHKVSR